MGGWVGRTYLHLDKLGIGLVGGEHVRGLGDGELLEEAGAGGLL